jgi:hypothetical protein
MAHLFIIPSQLQIPENHVSYNGAHSWYGVEKLNNTSPDMSINTKKFKLYTSVQLS